jgi:ketosteroid isomerase-like protein
MRRTGEWRNLAGMTQLTHTTSDPKIDAVGRLYAAYGRGDVDAVLAELADDVDWAAEAAGTGVPRFFAAIASNVEVTEFDVVSLTANDTDVVATVHWTFTVNATGKTASMYMQHWFRFGDGKIVLFRGSEDSAQSLAAFGLSR